MNTSDNPSAFDHLAMLSHQLRQFNQLYYCKISLTLSPEMFPRLAALVLAIALLATLAGASSSSNDVVNQRKVVTPSIKLPACGYDSINLTPLTASADLIVDDAVFRYDLNMCGVSRSQPGGPCLGSNAMLCQTEQDHGNEFNLGAWESVSGAPLPDPEWRTNNGTTFLYLENGPPDCYLYGVRTVHCILNVLFSHIMPQTTLFNAHTLLTASLARNRNTSAARPASFSSAARRAAPT